MLEILPPFRFQRALQIIREISSIRGAFAGCLIYGGEDTQEVSLEIIISDCSQQSPGYR